MSWWTRWFSKKEGEPTGANQIPLPVLLHTHARGTVFPGQLEEGMVEIEQDDFILHGVAGMIQPDGTFGELPEERMEWARRLVYQHLKREGCLAEFGIPVIPAYEEPSSG